MRSSSFGSNFELIVKYLYNSLFKPQECCNLKSTNELVLLIISLGNPGLKSQVNLKTIQNEKHEGHHSIHLNH